MLYTTHLLRHLRQLIGQNIHRARARRQMPLHKLALATGVPVLKLDHYELGKSEIPFDHALRIACALDVSVDALLK